jgi:hypothetical protein
MTVVTPDGIRTDEDFEELLEKVTLPSRNA